MHPAVRAALLATLTVLTLGLRQAQTDPEQGRRVAAPSAQPRITTPKEQFGFDFGDDYQLANYKQIADYWRTLDAESDRMVAAGDRQDGRRPAAPDGDRHLAGEPQESARVQGHLAPAGARRRRRPTARRARWRRQGKAVVWIDGGLHATETLGAQQLAEMVYQMVSRDRRGDAAVPRRLHHPVRARQPGRQRSRRRLVHAQPGSGEAQRSPACRGSTRSTSATTTTATSSPRPSRRPRTSTACSTTSGCRRFSTTTTRAVRPARWCGRRRSAIPTTTTSIRC